jgi:glucoamylase
VTDSFAPGWPDIPARWTSSAKSGLGTAVSRDSRVWFTLSHGILNEIYYPRVDHAYTRDLGFIVIASNAPRARGAMEHPRRNLLSF